MFRYKILCFFTILILFPIVLLAQQREENDIIRNFERNYDSLLTSFYIKQNSKIIRTNLNKKNDNLYLPTSASNVPDSVYAMRLRALPSSIKLTYNQQVRNIIEYYIDKGGNRVGVLLGLSKYYFPIFEEILDQHSVPHELKYLVVIESALNPNAVSRAGATGLWQFMYSTGKMYDLRINSIVDDRKDPIKSSVAAARYLKDLYKIYDDWELALAAYNCGPGNVNKAMRRSGKKDFWGIYDFLPRETRGYVPAYVAACYVMNYYKEHNITPSQLTKPVATDTISVRRDMHFEQIADVLNIPFEQIKDLNPQYKTNIIMASQDNYSLKLPLNYIHEFITLEDSIAEHNKEKYFEPEWKQKYYTTKEVKLTHKVRKKETWSSIARKYGVSVKDLKRWNGNRKYPVVGRLLTVYRTIKVEIDKEDKDNKSPFTEETSVSNDASNQQEVNDNNSSSESEEVSKSSTTNKPSTPKSQSIRHKVRKGETVSSLSRKYNVPINEIIRLNNLNKNKPIIKIGQTLKIK
jgi:membrane-bound lytic murein transglycosylase D